MTYFFQALYAGSGLLLGALTMFIKYRRDIGAANKTIADANKTIAEKDKIIEERERTIAETKKLYAEAASARLEVLNKHFDLKDRIDADLKSYNAANAQLSDVLDALTTEIVAAGDGSALRNQAATVITTIVCPAFSTYVGKAQLEYLDALPKIVETFVEGDIFQFLRMLQSTASVMNEPKILAGCPKSAEPLTFTLASLSPAKRCLLECQDRVGDLCKERISVWLLAIEKGLATA